MQPMWRDSSIKLMKISFKVPKIFSRWLVDIKLLDECLKMARVNMKGEI